MTEETTTPPDIDTDPKKLAELAEAEKAQGVVDQQTAAAAKPDDAKPR